MLLRIVEHGGADATLEVGTGEHVVVDTRLTATPEGRIVSELLEGDRTVAQLMVDLEHSSATGETEELGLREEPLYCFCQNMRSCMSESCFTCFIIKCKNAQFA